MSNPRNKEEITKHIERLDKVITDSKDLLKSIPTLEGKVEIVKSLRLLEVIKIYFEEDLRRNKNNENNNID